MATPNPNPLEKQEGRKSKYVRQTYSNRIQIPKNLIMWKLPMVYEITSVSRQGNEVLIKMRIISEGE